VVLLKALLRRHGLKATYTGGLSSYALTLMAASFLLLAPRLRSERQRQQQQQQQLQQQQQQVGVCAPDAPPPAPPAPPPLSQLILECLHFFGCVYDPESHALGWSTAKGGGPAAVLLGRASSPGLSTFALQPLIVLDPLDDANNAGKGCYRFCQVQALFRAALAAAAAAAGVAADRAVASGQVGCAIDLGSLVTALMDASAGGEPAGDTPPPVAPAGA